MSGKVDISIIITAHREGVIAGATANSAQAAIARISDELALSCEIILVFDRASSVTEQVLSNAFGSLPVTVLRTDEGDPGQARNHGIAAAKGMVSTFLDGDDLWSSNWLTRGWKLAEQRPDCVFHSACNVGFGKERSLWWHIDSEGMFFDPEYLDWGNYWDAMSLARTDIYRAHPFHRNDLRLGFGHEDWHWNAVTIAAGIPHKPVPETVHFKRRRDGSQMALVERSGSVRRPLGI